MKSLRHKKQYFNKLLEILQKSDSLSIELDAEFVKTKAFDRAALILTGVSATLAIIAEEVEQEILGEEKQAKLDEEFYKLWEEEQRRFKNKNRPDPPKLEPPPDAVV